VCEVRASDKRITCDEEFSDSEDEGEGGRRHAESFKHKRIRLDEKTDGKTATTEKSAYFSIHIHIRLLIITMTECIMYSERHAEYIKQTRKRATNDNSNECYLK